MGLLEILVFWKVVRGGETAEWIEGPRPLHESLSRDHFQPFSGMQSTHANPRSVGSYHPHHFPGFVHPSYAHHQHNYGGDVFLIQLPCQISPLNRFSTAPNSPSAACYKNISPDACPHCQPEIVPQPWRFSHYPTSMLHQPQYGDAQMFYFPRAPGGDPVFSPHMYRLGPRSSY
jgi:hypothetical protein